MVFNGFKCVSKKLQGCFIKVTRKIEGCSEGVLRCFKEVSRVFHESFMEEEVSRMFQGCFMIFKGVSRVFQGSFSENFQGV